MVCWKTATTALQNAAPEERLQVLGQFGSTGVSWVHRNEQADTRRQPDLFANEVEQLLLGFYRILNALDLNGNDGQHLDRNSVELVEATPRARLRETFVYVADRLLETQHRKHSLGNRSTNTAVHDNEINNEFICSEGRNW